MTGRANDTIKGLYTIILTILILLSSFISLLPSWAVMGEDIAGSRGGVSGCPGSMPPEAVNGNRTGNWNITCEVVVDSTTIKLAGNITIDFGGSLTLSSTATVEQVVNDDGPFKFVVYNQASLTVDTSTLRTDDMVVFGSGDVFLRDSSVRVRGSMEVSGGLFELTSSILTIMPDVYGYEPDARMNISAKAVFIRSSTINLKGKNASPGNTTEPPGNGGDVFGSLTGHLVTGLDLNVLGGSGGRAWDQPAGNGNEGGKGGDADMEIMADEISDTSIDVIGGNGGKGGNGMGSLGAKDGGNGGDGGMAGHARLVVNTVHSRINDSYINVTGGSGGPGGEGGKTKGGSGGNGGQGADGGWSDLLVNGASSTMVDISLTSRAGSGGPGGKYGQDHEDIHHGSPGPSGSGGSSETTVYLFNDLTLEDDRISALGGPGAHGIPGWQFGSNGGDGGNGIISIFSGGNLSFGPSSGSDRTSIKAQGGDAGNGGDYEGGMKEEFMGRTGTSGSANLTIDVLGSADIYRTDISSEHGDMGIGRPPKDQEKMGTESLILSAARYNVTDSTSTTPFEGLRGTGRGYLINTTVEGNVPAIIWPWEKEAVIEVFWGLEANMSPMFEDQHARIRIFDTDAEDERVLDSCDLRGDWDTCLFLILGESITYQGNFQKNYTIQGETDDGVGSKELSFHISSNRFMTLVPGENFYAPHIDLIYPENGATFTVEDMADGIIKVHGTTYEDIRDEPKWIERVQVVIVNWQTRESIVFDSDEDVNITPLSSSVSSWSLEWDLTELVGYMPVFTSGAYSLCVRAFDGKVWSDDPDVRRGGEDTCINIAIFQMEGKKTVVPIPLDFPSRVEGTIPIDGDYIELDLDVSVIDSLGATMTYYNFEWDLDLDGEIDWSYKPINGTHPPRAVKVFTESGFYTARFYATDINGDVWTTDTQIIIKKEVGSKPAPVAIPDYCLFGLLLLLLVMGVAYIGALLNEAFRFGLLTYLFVPLHKRYRKKLDGEDKIRRQITEYIIKKPGRFFTRARYDLELSGLLLAREFSYLEERGYATHKRDGMRIRLISTRRMPRKKKTLKKWEKNILRALIKKPWQSATALSKQLGRTEAFIERQLLKLEKRNLAIVKFDEEEGPLYRAKIPTKKKRTYKRKRPKGPSLEITK